MSAAEGQPEDPVLVELRAIRSLLERQSLCGHGATGLCMICLTPVVDFAIRQGLSR